MQVARKTIRNVVDWAEEHVDNLANELFLAWKHGKIFDVLLGKVCTLAAKGTFEFESFVLFGKFCQNLSWSNFVVIRDGVKKLTFECARVGVFVNRDIAH